MIQHLEHAGSHPDLVSVNVHHETAVHGPYAQLFPAFDFPEAICHAAMIAWPSFGVKFAETACLYDAVQLLSITALGAVAVQALDQPGTIEQLVVLA